MDTLTAVGPLINAAAVDKVDELVRDALQKGARAVLGGSRHSRGGNFYEPTILTGIRPNMALNQDRNFRPRGAIAVV